MISQYKMDKTSTHKNTLFKGVEFDSILSGAFLVTTVDAINKIIFHGVAISVFEGAI